MRLGPLCSEAEVVVRSEAPMDALRTRPLAWCPVPSSRPWCAGLVSAAAAGRLARNSGRVSFDRLGPDPEGCKMVAGD